MEDNGKRIKCFELKAMNTQPWGTVDWLMIVTDRPKTGTARVIAKCGDVKLSDTGRMNST
jgi:hypothetical protein